MQELSCTVCGGELIKKDNSTMFQCKCCNAKFEHYSFEEQKNQMRELLDEQKEKQLANLRQNLWKEVRQKYIA